MSKQYYVVPKAEKGKQLDDKEVRNLAGAIIAATEKLAKLESAYAFAVSKNENFVHVEAKLRGQSACVSISIIHCNDCHGWRCIPTGKVRVRVDSSSPHDRSVSFQQAKKGVDVGGIAAKAIEYAKKSVMRMLDRESSEN